jgi:stage IV sporulation protein FB
VFEEPSRTPYDVRFPLLGIPVRIHPLFWLVTVLLGYQGCSDGVGLLIWMTAVFVSILVHELGHALVMRMYGYRPWIVLYGMGGLACHDPRGAYVARRSHDTLERIVICAAGPAAGFLLAAVLVAALYAAGCGDRIGWTSPWSVCPYTMLSNERLAYLFNAIFYVSVYWDLVNLLPIYPLDGGQIAREILIRIHPGDGIRLSMVVSILAAGAMAAYGWTEMKSPYVAFFFGYLAFSSFTALQAYGGRHRW